jgi:hypothetical protein
MMRAYFAVGGKADALFAADGAKKRPSRTTKAARRVRQGEGREEGR